jgi:hypothetical protein
MSEFLRVQQRGGKVSEHQERQHQRDDSDKVHGLPQLLTGLDVQKGHGKKNDGVEQHGEILHATSLDSKRHCAVQTDSKIDFAGRGVVLAEGKSKEDIKTG